MNGEIKNSRRIIRSLKAKADARRSFVEKTADFMTAIFGSVTFLFLNLVWFSVWIVVNLNWIPGIAAFDPFPFGLLTMVVSLEAIFLAIIVLISQNRTGKVNDWREEVDLQVDVVTETELTKLLHMVSVLMEKNGIETIHDQELQNMLKTTNLEKIEKALEKQISI